MVPDHRQIGCDTYLAEGKTFRNRQAIAFAQRGEGGELAGGVERCDIAVADTLQDQNIALLQGRLRGRIAG